MQFRSNTGREICLFSWKKEEEFMNYSIVKCINGAFSIHAETSDLNSAKVSFHGLCQTLWNAPDVLSAYVMIVDEQLDVVEGYKEYIHHEVTAPAEPEEQVEE
jgi:hypothetical protein